MAYVNSVHSVAMAEYEMIQPAPVVFKADVWTHVGSVCTICNAGVKYYNDDVTLKMNVKRVDSAQRTTDEVNIKKTTSNLNPCNQNNVHRGPLNCL